ncbi:MAG: tetratricopeptide repeat protein, partial [Planctomycetaceae bacterium]
MSGPESQRTVAVVAARWRSGVLAVVLLGIAVLAAVSGRNGSASRAEVPQFDQRGMDRVVLELLSDVRGRVERQQADAESWGQYGMCLLQHDRPREALLCFRQARQLDPQNPRWPWFSAMILEQTDLAAAVAELQLAFDLAPDAVHVRLKLAATKLAQGDWATTEQLLRPLAKDSAATAASLLEQARAARLRNAPGDVLKILEEGRGQSSSLSAELLEEAAVAALQSGQPELARSLRLESVQYPRQPRVDDPWLAGLRAFDVSGGADSAAADQLRAQGRLEDAAARLAVLARRFPDRSRPALNLALARRDQGQPEQAVAELQRLVKRFPTDPLVHFHLAVTEAQLGRIEPALSNLSESLRLKPDYGIARSALADLLAAGGRLSEALVEAERAAV